jgi:tetratricopeptide (TPR) repeat protein
MFDLMRRSAVNLCLPSEFQPIPHPMLKGLNLEIAAAGALQVTHPSREVTDVLGDTVATAETLADFVGQARYFLAHPAEGQAMGRQSRSALADRLADRGIQLDLGAPAGRPAVQDTHVLYLTAIGLAHLFEGQGRTEQAEVYFKEALGYDPHDYAANAGLARLATDTAVAAGLWRTAHAGVGLTHPLFAETGLPTKVLSSQGTLFAMESLVRWLAALFEEGRADEAVAAIEQAGHLQGSIGIETAGVLHRQGHVFHALRCLTSVIEADPGCGEAYRARSQVYRQQGLTAQAEADLRQGEALSRHRRHVPPLPAE